MKGILFRLSRACVVGSPLYRKRVCDGYASVAVSWSQGMNALADVTVQWDINFTLRQGTHPFDVLIFVEQDCFERLYAQDYLCS